MKERGYSAGRDQDAVGHPAAVLRLRLQQGALRGLRPGLLLDRLPQGQLPGRVHGRAADLGQGRQGQDGDLPQRVPPDGASRCCRPTSTSPTANFTPVGTDIRFGLTAIRNVGGNVVDGIVAAREEKGRFTDFNDFMDKVAAAGLQQAGHRVADQGRRLRLAGAPRAGRWSRSTRTRSTSTSTSSATRRSARTRCSAASTTRPEAGFGVAVAVPDIDEWDKTTLLGHEREMLGLYVSDHPLLGLEHILSGGSRLHHRPAAARRGPGRRLDGHRLAA